MPCSHGSRPEYEVSRWPLNISDGALPEPAHVPSTLARPSSTCCHCTCSPIPSRTSRTASAQACSEPVNDGMETSRIASSTRRSRSIIGNAGGLPCRTARSARAACRPTARASRACSPASRYSSIAAMQSAGVPAMGLHLSRIASVTSALAASRPPRSIASATGRISSWSSSASSSSVSAEPRMFCTLFGEIHPGDLARAVASLVAVVADGGDDGAADVDVGLDVPARVADEGGRRDRRRQAAVARSRPRAPASSAPSRPRRPAARRAARRRPSCAGTSALHVSPS